MFLVSIIDFYFLNKKKCLARAAHMNTQLKEVVILAALGRSGLKELTR